MNKKHTALSSVANRAMTVPMHCIMDSHYWGMKLEAGEKVYVTYFPKPLPILDSPLHLDIHLIINTSRSPTPFNKTPNIKEPPLHQDL